MRVRLAVVVLAVACGPWVAVPAAAQDAQALACTNLPGTFSETWAPIYLAEEVPAGDMTFQASGSCLLNGETVTANVTGSGKSGWAGICGYATWSTSMDPSGPQVRPWDAATLDVTLTLTPAASGNPVVLTETWEITATMDVESNPFTVGGGQQGAGDVVTRILAHCPDGPSTLGTNEGGTDRAFFTWTQTA
jgi:hypothetical protein